MGHEGQGGSPLPAGGWSGSVQIYLDGAHGLTRPTHRRKFV